MGVSGLAAGRGSFGLMLGVLEFSQPCTVAAVDWYEVDWYESVSVPPKTEAAELLHAACAVEVASRALLAEPVLV
jgi:hypothetical protein